MSDRATQVPHAALTVWTIGHSTHRQLIADALVARGVQIRHILSAAPAEAHHLTSFVVVVDGRVSYPGLLG